MQPPGRRREHHAEPRRSAFDQSDVDRIIVAAADELLGAVKRVDQEIELIVRRDAPGRDLLLGDHRNPRRGPRERSKDEQLGRAVRFGDGRRVALRFDIEAAPYDRENGLASFARGIRQIVHQASVVDAQRGAIRIPPSSRTAAAFM